MQPEIPSFQIDNTPVAVSATEAEFVEDALRNWDASNSPRARFARRQWYERHLAPDILDEKLLAIVLGRDEESD